jgi:hypothetical protein
MTKKDFFRIIIKLIGLYLIAITLYAQLPFISSLLFFKNGNFSFIPYTISYFAICVLLFIILVFYTDKVIALFKLDEGFDEDRIEFSNFGAESILKLALIFTGCMLIIKNIPSFFNQTYCFIQLHFDLFDTISYASQNTYLWATSFINLSVGYLLLTNYASISKFLLKRNKKKP